MGKRSRKKREKRQNKSNKNYNPTGKSVFAIWRCPRCGRTDIAIIPPVMKVNVPFFVNCGCGYWVMYHGAWITDPYKSSDIFTRVAMGDITVWDIINKELEDVTDKLEPDGTMMNLNTVIENNPEIIEDIKRRMKDDESKQAMFA